MGNTIRRLAASILGCGESRLWINPAEGKRVDDALTRDDVRTLIKDGVIKAHPVFGVSRVRGRKKQEGKRKGRRRGMGSRKGTASARSSDKTEWMARVRKQRGILSRLRSEKKIEKTSVRKVYNMVKGGAFKGKGTLLAYLKENKILKG